jgi:preprotein translocase subunit Sec61beta
VGGGSFVWDRDSLWNGLEAAFRLAREQGCADSIGIAGQLEALTTGVHRLTAEAFEPAHSYLDSIELAFFQAAPPVAACPAFLSDYVRAHAALRAAVKRQSLVWNLDTREARDRLYRLLYGARAAVEEASLQHPDRMVTLVPGTDEPSAAPSAVVRGVTVHSGDMLVSRGGYPTSALIARGNDYPGNFSHIGLVHVDAESGDVSVIEAHIESGVSIGTAEAYLSDKKLRIMVLRPRAGLPQLVADSMLPHRAATMALERARQEHIPYDFEMNYEDPSRLFCSEVASAVYREAGVELWAGISTISNAGLRRWLSSVGVRYFETQEPSDLEYDPQLVVVAEWRDAATLFQDHLDNAVIDAMLEGAERGHELEYAWTNLPLARVAKGYSWLLNRVGRVGPIPEGMSPSAALRSQAFSERQRRIAAGVVERAARFEQAEGYVPPYWILLGFAREAVVAE